MTIIHPCSAPPALCATATTTVAKRRAPRKAKEQQCVRHIRVRWNKCRFSQAIRYKKDGTPTHHLHPQQRSCVVLCACCIRRDLPCMHLVLHASGCRGYLHVDVVESAARECGWNVVPATCYIIYTASTQIEISRLLLDSHGDSSLYCCVLLCWVLLLCYNSTRNTAAIL